MHSGTTAYRKIVSALYVPYDYGSLRALFPIGNSIHPIATGTASDVVLVALVSRRGFLSVGKTLEF